jgi:hypothetical protein
MQLDLGTRERSISIDSRLEGFTEVAAAAALQAGRRGRTLDQNTLSNLNALGVRGDRDV